ncbi:hypothetical protein COOONC_26706 [Cooperia oncophora]
MPGSGALRDHHQGVAIQLKLRMIGRDLRILSALAVMSKKTLRHVTTGLNRPLVIIARLLQSPEGTEIEVKLVNFTKGLSVDGCSYAGVEIKTNKDQTLTGYRCRSLVPSGFCKGTLSEATKKKVCPKSCGFCDSLH